MNNKKVWFITGASKGLGLELVKLLLEKGYNVAATSRSAEALSKAVGNHSSSFFAIEMDMASADNVEEGIDKAVAKFGRIDIIVNNAGYGLVGSLEELTDNEARDNFDINVFGTLNIIRAAMPYLRKQESGHIFNIASIGGFSGMFPGFGIYCATKFAIHGLTESLATEIKSFGIKATIVSPGYFRTNFLETDSLKSPAKEIAAYKEVRDMQKLHQEQINGTQPGDPVKGATAIITAAESDTPPMHLFLGEDAYNMAYQKIKEVESDLERWKTVTISTGY